MTDEQKDFKKETYKETPISELLLTIVKLTGKFLVVVLKHLFKLILKTIVFIGEKCGEGIDAAIRFWRSNDTQEKKRRIIASCKKGGKKFLEYCSIAWQWTKRNSQIGAKLVWKYTVIGSKLFCKYLLMTIIAIWHGILWSGKTAKDLIIHSKPTFIRLGKNIKQGSIDFWHWLKRVGRGIRLRHIKRRRAWKEFRRNTTFKGLLISMVKSITNGITSYMEEDQTETAPDSITEDDILAEEMDEKQNAANKFGKKLFNGVKDIVEEKDIDN